MAAEAFPLHWPVGWPRTQRLSQARFTVTLSGARDDMLREVAMLGGSHIVLSSNLRLRQDGLPTGKQTQPTDRGVAVYFLWRGRQMVFACDRWGRVEDNIRAIGLTIEAIRGIDRWGASEMLERAVQAFEALPPPKSCWDILGIKPGASADDVTKAYRSKARAAHPDTGGSADAMSELNRARDQAFKA